MECSKFLYGFCLDILYEFLLRTQKELILVSFQISTKTQVHLINTVNVLSKCLCPVRVCGNRFSCLSCHKSLDHSLLAILVLTNGNLSTETVSGLILFEYLACQKKRTFNEIVHEIATKTAPKTVLKLSTECLTKLSQNCSQNCH